MSRRLLGPVGGPFMFFLIAALVFAGLGWVTVAALRVEQAQREAAAQAELGYNLRVAVRQLDTRVLFTLAVEDNRPFYHYNSADPNSGSTAGPTPLLAAQLPEWMKLHVQLDPAVGWDSPQVLTPEAAERVLQAWPDLSLRNYTPSRADVLNSVRAKYPVVATCDVLAARDRATPADAGPFAAPLFDPHPQVADSVAALTVPPADPLPKPPPPADIAPVKTNLPTDRASESFRLLGWELPRRESVANSSPKDNLKKSAPEPGSGSQVQAPLFKPAAFPPVAPPPGGAVGRAYPLTEKELQQLIEYRNRSGTISRGVLEAKNAGLDFPQYGQGRMQNSVNPGGDGKTQVGGGLNQNTTGLPGFGQMPTQPAAPATGNTKADKDGQDPGSKGKVTVPGDLSDPMQEKMKDAARDKASELMKQLQTEQLRGTLSEHLATACLGLDRRRCLDEIQLQELGKWQRVDGGFDDTVFAAGLGVAWAVGGRRFVLPGEERPVPAAQNTTNAMNNFAFNTIAGPPGVNIHVGSMRPQWITAADGTETLVLVRTAKIDNKVVYQGVVLDWPKLEEILKAEVKDLFPDAKLVPVKDPAGISPDRAMTALPVQLDPGPAAALPPAGWTPLRFGLVLAWVAALVAFAAVGFSGWSLIDLAERRIRFVSAVTHELRTPLTSLRLYLDLLMSGMIHDEAKRQEYLNTLATESDRLHRLIDNVLDFAKLEKRAKNGDMKPVKVGELLEQLRQTWTDRVAADGKELVVISTLSPDTEVCTDPAMVHQIVGNLIDNARKYTRDAEDKRIWLWAKPGGNGRIVFEVEDRGAGVPASERKSIFKPFRRGTQADAKAGGAGLGLALAKQWAEVLGGTVAYRPADGAPGACFRLELPMK